MDSMGDLWQDKEEWRWVRSEEEMEKNHRGRLEVDKQRRCCLGGS